MKSKQKKRLQNRPTPFFILSIVKRDYVKDKDEIFNIPAFDCKFDGFCAGGKKELAEMLSGVRMSKDRMNELRYLCNAIGLSEEEQEEIREIIKFPQKLTKNSEKW